MVWNTSNALCLICVRAVKVNMGANDAMTSTRLRKYDLQRIQNLKMPREANWEFIMRLLNDYETRGDA
jgi:hypothetical protein